MSERLLLESIRAEAERLRSDGPLPEGFESQAREVFASIAEGARARAAAGPGGEGGAGTGADGETQVPPATALGPVPRSPAALARGALRVTRRVAGRQTRALQRSAVERAARAAAGTAVGLQVLSERAGRVLADPRAERLLARSGLAGAVAPGSDSGAAHAWPASAALRWDGGGRLADRGLESLLAESLRGAGGGRALHAECGDGAVVERLRSLGFLAEGAGSLRGGDRRGALQALWRAAPGSLAVVILSGVVDRATPSRARALSRLTVRRLAPGGRLVLLSTHPGGLLRADPVSADLAPGRPLLPVTWVHLLASGGLEDVALRESADKTAYAVAARRPQG